MTNYLKYMSFTFFVFTFAAGMTIIAQPSFSFGDGVLDLSNPHEYANQAVPNYIRRDNTPASNPITNEGATLGRVLFYDTQLSIDDSVSCSTCHQQEFAFSDPDTVSMGVNGFTGRHSMRLINARFAEEDSAFWDERAATIEDQVTRPIQDHVEMGFSGQDGNPDFDDLIEKLEALDYYPPLFTNTFGDGAITEERMKRALAQFVRSIQSFDSKYDAGRVLARNDNQLFANFTQDENRGKELFLQRPILGPNGVRTGGGAGCAACHRPPEFDIDPNSRNNGVIRAIDGSIDLTNTKSPSLRDMVDQNGAPHTGFMHDGGQTAANLNAVLGHYNAIPQINDNRQNRNALDPRLRPGGNLQRLNLTQQERNQMVQFMRTLTGSNVYVGEKWSDPFDVNGELEVLPQENSVSGWSLH
ncbi:MAG: cytochrome-c peroxidase [Candidatus Hinthialibacter antarcticus]|nr:cytochrome-c peroxidase [Candidatus Hinthialibacter antarcticus]